MNIKRIIQCYNILSASSLKLPARELPSSIPPLWGSCDSYWFGDPPATVQCTSDIKSYLSGVRSLPTAHRYEPTSKYCCILDPRNERRHVSMDHSPYHSEECLRDAFRKENKYRKKIWQSARHFSLK